MRGAGPSKVQKAISKLGAATSALSSAILNMGLRSGIPLVLLSPAVSLLIRAIDNAAPEERREIGLRLNRYLAAHEAYRRSVKRTIEAVLFTKE